MGAMARDGTLTDARDRSDPRSSDTLAWLDASSRPTMKSTKTADRRTGRRSRHDRARRRARARPHRARRARARAIACRPSASWRCRSASAARRCAPACRRSPPMGVIQARHGAGTFITDGPPMLATGPLSFLAALHGFSSEEMFEARRVLEVGAIGVAAAQGHRPGSRQRRRGDGRHVRRARRCADLPDPRHHVPPRRRPGRRTTRSSRR